MGRKLDNVVAFYLHGVSDGHVLPAADKYLAAGFVDHSVPAADGRLEFVHAYEPLVNRYDDRLVWPLRGFEDGSKVFLHSYQSFGRGQVTRVCADVFDTDDEDQVTTRWNVTVPAVSSSRSGRTQIDGPTYVTDLEQTGRNKRRWAPRPTWSSTSIASPPGASPNTGTPRRGSSEPADVYAR